MDISQPTVTVEQFDDLNAIKMTWQRWVDDYDVSAALQTIDALLEAAEQPLYVVVDISSDPNVPLRQMLNEVIGERQGSNKLQEWLVIGTNPAGRIIERNLAKVTG